MALKKLETRAESFSSLITLLIPIIFLPSFHSLTLNCRYNEWDWNFHQNVYECQGSHVHLEDTLPYMTNFTGIHMGGGNHTEVQALRVMHQPTITFVPTGIGKFFPNLLGLSFMNCNLKIISKDHLEEFPEMLQVSYNLNQIEVIPGDLFIYTPKLRLVNFAGNNIKHIAVSVFKPLKNLEYIWLAKNVCIDQNSKVSELKKLKKEIVKKCKMGGKVDCKKIPAAFNNWNITKAVDTCEVIHVYKFTPKPRHELIRLQREKEEQEAKKREHLVNKVLKICEYDDEVYRFLEIVFNIPGSEDESEKKNDEKKKKNEKNVKSGKAKNKK